MKKFTLIFGVLTLLIFFSVIKSDAAAMSTTTKQVVSLIASTYDAPAQKFLLKSLAGPDNRGFRVVFVYNGNRYTFDHDWWTDGIQIWIRPNSTYHPDIPAHVLADNNMDGVVDFGTDGHVRIFTSLKGQKHQQYWQNILDEAFAGLRDAIR